jgi:hypothetical protein
MFPEDIKAIEIVTGKIRVHLPAFERLGLVFERAFTAPSTLVNSSHWSVFRHKSGAARVSLSFSVIRHGKGGLFGTYIETPDQKRMAVRDYLRVHGLPEQESLFQCPGDIADFERYVDEFLAGQEDLFAGALRPFIEGEKWEDVPLDWEPYK